MASERFSASLPGLTERLVGVHPAFVPNYWSQFGVPSDQSSESPGFLNMPFPVRLQPLYYHSNVSPYPINFLQGPLHAASNIPAHNVTHHFNPTSVNNIIINTNVKQENQFFHPYPIVQMPVLTPLHKPESKQTLSAGSFSTAVVSADHKTSPLLYVPLPNNHIERISINDDDVRIVCQLPRGMETSQPIPVPFPENEVTQNSQVPHVTASLTPHASQETSISENKIIQESQIFQKLPGYTVYYPVSVMKPFHGNVISPRNCVIPYSLSPVVPLNVNNSHLSKEPIYTYVNPHMHSLNLSEKNICHQSLQAGQISTDNQELRKEKSTIPLENENILHLKPLSEPSINKLNKDKSDNYGFSNENRNEINPSFSQNIASEVILLENKKQHINNEEYFHPPNKDHSIVEIPIKYEHRNYSNDNTFALETLSGKDMSKCYNIKSRDQVETVFSDKQENLTAVNKKRFLNVANTSGTMAFNNNRGNLKWINYKKIKAFEAEYSPRFENCNYQTESKSIAKGKSSKCSENLDTCKTTKRTPKNKCECQNLDLKMSVNSESVDPDIKILPPEELNPSATLMKSRSYVLSNILNIEKKVGPTCDCKKIKIDDLLCKEGTLDDSEMTENIPKNGKPKQKQPYSINCKRKRKNENCGEKKIKRKFLEIPSVKKILPIEILHHSLRNCSNNLTENNISKDNHSPNNLPYTKSHDSIFTKSNINCKEFNSFGLSNCITSVTNVPKVSQKPIRLTVHLANWNKDVEPNKLNLINSCLQERPMDSNKNHKSKRKPVRLTSYLGYSNILPLLQNSTINCNFSEQPMIAKSFRLCEEKANCCTVKHEGCRDHLKENLQKKQKRKLPVRNKSIKLLAFGRHKQKRKKDKTSQLKLIMNKDLKKTGITKKRSQNTKKVKSKSKSIKNLKNDSNQDKDFEPVEISTFNVLRQQALDSNAELIKKENNALDKLLLNKEKPTINSQGRQNCNREIGDPTNLCDTKLVDKEISKRSTVNKITKRNKSLDKTLKEPKETEKQELFINCFPIETNIDLNEALLSKIADHKTNLNLKTEKLNDSTEISVLRGNENSKLKNISNVLESDQKYINSFLACSKDMVTGANIHKEITKNKTLDVNMFSLLRDIKTLEADMVNINLKKRKLLTIPGLCKNIKGNNFYTTSNCISNSNDKRGVGNVDVVNNIENSADINISYNQSQDAKPSALIEINSRTGTEDKASIKIREKMENYSDLIVTDENKVQDNKNILLENDSLENFLDITVPISRISYSQEERILALKSKLDLINQTLAIKKF